jgi:hypothetical protein
VIDAPAVGLGIVNVQLPESVTVWTLPVVRASVVEVPLLPTVAVCSRTMGRRARATVPVRFPASTLVGIGTISHADPVHE